MTESMNSQWPNAGLDAIASSAEIRLRRSRNYRNAEQYDALIAGLRTALAPYHPTAADLSVPVGDGENPLRRLGRPHGGYANGFIKAFTAKDGALTRLTNEHTLFHVGLAALSLAEAGDNVDAAMTLQAMTEIWRDGRGAQAQAKKARLDRSPFVALLRQLRSAHPQATAKEIWHRLPGDYTVGFNDQLLEIGVTVSPNGESVDWVTGGSIQGGSCPYKNFATYLSKYAPKKLS